MAIFSFWKKATIRDLALGHSCSAKCKKCGAELEVKHGGGFCFHLLHCDKCGKDEAVHFDKLGELHLRYLKGLDMPYSTASFEFDGHVQKHYQGEPISEADYHKAIEKMIRKCRCGGTYRFEAPPRCPSCGSADIVVEEGVVCFYD